MYRARQVIVHVLRTNDRVSGSARFWDQIESVVCITDKQRDAHTREGRKGNRGFAHCKFTISAYGAPSR